MTVETIYAEIERTIRSTVEVDVAAFVAYNAADRADFHGTDAEYVASCIQDEAREYLEAQRDDHDSGVRVSEEWDETEAVVLTPLHETP